MSHIIDAKNVKAIYSSDLTDEQWEIILPLILKFQMRARKWSKRILINAVFYVLRTGCQWRELPRDYPPYTTVSSFYHRAIESGFWDALLAKLVEISRVMAGRNPEPSYGVIDSQSIKTVGASEDRGIDGGKKN